MAVALFLILALLSALCGVTGVALLFGIGWALVAASVALALAAGLIGKGLRTGG